MSLYRAEGVVLRTIKLGESDRIITLYTKERGKVRAVAKGVRKTSSRFGARVEPLSHIAVQLYEGRDLDTVTQVETVAPHRVIREDLDRLAAGLTLLETVDAVAEQGHPDGRLFQMLVGALGALERRSSPLLVSAFLLRVMAHEGVAPELDACVACGRSDALVALDVAGGGVRCSSCRQGSSLGAGALDLLRDILGGRLGAALDEPESGMTAEVGSVAVKWFEYHLERRLRSGHLAL